MANQDPAEQAYMRMKGRFEARRGWFLKKKKENPEADLDEEARKIYDTGRDLQILWKALQAAQTAARQAQAEAMAHAAAVQAMKANGFATEPELTPYQRRRREMNIEMMRTAATYGPERARELSIQHAAEIWADHC